MLRDVSVPVVVLQSQRAASVSSAQSAANACERLRCLFVEQGGPLKSTDIGAGSASLRSAVRAR